MMVVFPMLLQRIEAQSFEERHDILERVRTCRSEEGACHNCYIWPEFIEDG